MEGIAMAAKTARTATTTMSSGRDTPACKHNEGLRYGETVTFVGAKLRALGQ